MVSLAAEICDEPCSPDSEPRAWAWTVADTQVSDLSVSFQCGFKGFDDGDSAVSLEGPSALVADVEGNDWLSQDDGEGAAHCATDDENGVVQVKAKIGETLLCDMCQESSKDWPGTSSEAVNHNDRQFHFSMGL